MPEVSVIMGPREQERWEQFCRTGLVCDYLNYRAAVEHRQAGLSEGESVDADRDQSGGALGQEYGRI